MNSNQKGPDLNGLRKAIDRRWNRSQAKQLASIQIEINNFLAKAIFRTKKRYLFKNLFKESITDRFSISGHSAWQEETETFLALIAIAIKHLSIVFVYTDTQKDQKLEQKPAI